MKSGYKCDPYMVKKFKKGWLSDKCGWKWESHQKRRGRSQKEHLQKLASVVRDLEYPNGTWRNTNGRPTKEEEIKAYAAEHPEANHSQIAKALGVSRPTVIKWLKDND